jgi:oxygen-dependent protoporphyrinogen oxidase
VRGLRRTPTGFALVVGPTIAAEEVLADEVVLATPAAPTARLLADVVPVVAAELAEVEYASMAVVTLAFAATELPDLPGSGFLVPPVDGRTIKAATFSFAKWDWVREAGATSGGLLVLRTSVGRHREESVLQVPDEDLVAASLADLAAATGLVARPVDSRVQRWGGGLPQYAVGHVERVRRIREAVAAVPGLALCGAAYDGVGIPAVIGSARRAAAMITQAE